MHEISATHLTITINVLMRFASIFPLFFSLPALCQRTTIIDTTSDPNHPVVIAGKQYDRSGLHDLFWGSHYRKEWTTQVKVNAVFLDTLEGGLTPILKGGGRQTRTLRLKNRGGQQYVLRSIDKTFGRALPEIFRGTFSENVINDQVSIAHPYASVTVPMLAEAAKIYHTNPRIVYVPSQKALGEFNDEFKNQLYLFEERAAGNEEDVDNFGNTEDVDATDKLLKKLLEENDHRVDQVAYVRARLFDMFVSDWGRHEDQWRWAKFKENDINIYRPIPRDRDQVYTKFDGIFVHLGTRQEALNYLQSFDYKIKDVKKFNFQARHLDRLLANEPSKETWIFIAKDLQQSLTDSIIEESVKQLPPEIFPISGDVIIAKLKSRRDDLVNFATKYYLFLAKQVEITGTKQKEIFEVKGIDDHTVTVQVFDMDSTGNKKEKPFYSRTFLENETKEIRLYGIDGKDRYSIEGNIDNAFTIRIIGGPKRDSFNIQSSAKEGRVKIYDDHENDFGTTGNAKLYLSNDSSIHAYNYAGFEYDAQWLKPGLSYSNEDRLFVRLGYHFQNQKWRTSPFGSQHDLRVNYSITQKAFSTQYLGEFNNVIGKWGLGLVIDYDQVRDVHYPGIGNNVVLTNDARNYYRMRTKEFYSSAGFNRYFGGYNKVSISGFYRLVQVLKDAGKFIEVIGQPDLFSFDYYMGARGDYRYVKVNHRLFPTKGASFITSVEYTHNLKESNKNVTRFSGLFGFYVPLARSLTLAVKTGAATLTGNPEFYQLNKIGAGETLRGFLRYRFYGKTAAYNQNELQYNFDVKTFLFNGKMGLLALLDDGRVWQPGEDSNKWHVGYGGGIMLAPFNKISITTTYAISDEDQRFSLRLGRLF